MPRASKRCAGGMMHWLLLPNRRGNQRYGLCAVFLWSSFSVR